VPLDDRNQANVHGALLVHTAQVGPGPLAQQFLALAQQVRTVAGVATGNRPAGTATWLRVPEQNVKFDVQDGRVTHHELTMSVGDVTIRTTGSVGLDETLELAAEVPIPEEWIANRPILAGLKGTVLKIPVGGTFSQPRVDAQALRDFGRQMLRGTAGRMLEGELQRGLERLLGPRN
jgi:translocation and assembly module TamB